MANKFAIRSDSRGFYNGFHSQEDGLVFPSWNTMAQAVEFDSYMEAQLLMGFIATTVEADDLAVVIVR